MLNHKLKVDVKNGQKGVWSIHFWPFLTTFSTMATQGVVPLTLKTDFRGSETQLQKSQSFLTPSPSMCEMKSSKYWYKFKDAAKKMLNWCSSLLQLRQPHQPRMNERSHRSVACRCLVTMEPATCYRLHWGSDRRPLHRRNRTLGMWVVVVVVSSDFG